MVDVSVKVTGLRELATAFRQIDSELPKEMRKSFMAISQHVVGLVQQRMVIRSGRAAGSVKARATPRGASIAAGGTAAPYYPWLDFGGSVGRGHKEGVPWSGSVRRATQKGGRYLYPAIAEARPEIEAGVDAAVEKTARSAGFDTWIGG